MSTVSKSLFCTVGWDDLKTKSWVLCALCGTVYIIIASSISFQNRSFSGFSLPCALLLMWNKFYKKSPFTMYHTKNWFCNFFRCFQEFLNLIFHLVPSNAQISRGFLNFLFVWITKFEPYSRRTYCNINNSNYEYRLITISICLASVPWPLIYFPNYCIYCTYFLN